MRRISGTYDGQEWIIFEYTKGMVECSTALSGRLQNEAGALPTGASLTEACRRIFGPTMVIREMPDDAADRR